MADEEALEEQEEQEAEDKASSISVKTVIIAVVAAVLLSGAISGGAMYMMGVFDGEPGSSDGEEVAEAEEDEEDDEDDEEKVSKGPPKYFSMDPKFVISFREQKSARFMQFSLQLMSREKDAMTQVDTHMPAVRSSLLMLFGQQNYDEMVTREGKEKLLQGVVEDVNATLTRINDDDEFAAIEAAYFDSFVIQ